MEIIHVNDAKLLAGLNKYLHGPHVTIRPDIFKPFEEEAVAKYFSRCLADEHYYHIGVVIDGVLVGFIQAEVKCREENELCYPYRYIHIHQLAVNPAYRRRGIAKALVDTVEEIAVTQDVRRIDLTVWDFNGEATAFYAACGFKADLVRMYKMVE